MSTAGPEPNSCYSVFVNFLIFILVHLTSGVLVVTHFIHDEPVGPVPEQFVISFVRYNMVNDICRFEDMI